MFGFGKNDHKATNKEDAGAQSSADAGDATRTVKAPHELPPTSGAEAIIRKWTKWSAGFGLVPIPLLDFATTTGFSLKMLSDLAKYYNVEFRGERARSALAALIGGAGSPMLTLAAGSLVGGIPLIGAPLALLFGPVVSGAVTYAIGRVFIAHFGAGGTLFDFDPEKFRDYFQEQIEAGKVIVKESKEPKVGEPASAS